MPVNTIEWKKSKMGLIIATCFAFCHSLDHNDSHPQRHAKSVQGMLWLPEYPLRETLNLAFLRYTSFEKPDIKVSLNLCAFSLKNMGS